MPRFWNYAWIRVSGYMSPITAVLSFFFHKRVATHKTEQQALKKNSKEIFQKYFHLNL